MQFHYILLAILVTYYQYLRVEGIANHFPDRDLLIEKHTLKALLVDLLQTHCDARVTRFLPSLVYLFCVEKKEGRSPSLSDGHDIFYSAFIQESISILSQREEAEISFLSQCMFDAAQKSASREDLLPTEGRRLTETLEFRRNLYLYFNIWLGEM